MTTGVTMPHDMIARCPDSASRKNTPRGQEGDITGVGSATKTTTANADEDSVNHPGTVASVSGAIR